MPRFILIGLVGLALTGCTSTSFISNEQNTWIARGMGSSTQPYYCVANKSDKDADPACYRAKMLNKEIKKGFWE